MAKNYAVRAALLFVFLAVPTQMAQAFDLAAHKIEPGVQLYLFQQRR